MPYGGGQITEINEEEMTVTFVAHRGWGPDGRTIYYIVTDATPSGPAEMMGVVDHQHLLILLQILQQLICSNLKMELKVQVH